MDGTGAPLYADVGESRKLPHTASSDEISPLADSVIYRNVNLPRSIPQSCWYSHMTGFHLVTKTIAYTKQT